MRNEFKHKEPNWRACSEKTYTGTNALSKQKPNNDHDDNKHNDNKMPLIIITFFYSWMYDSNYDGCMFHAIFIVKNAREKMKILLCLQMVSHEFWIMYLCRYTFYVFESVK